MFCVMCGAGLPESALFCPECGQLTPRYSRPSFSYDTKTPSLVGYCPRCGTAMTKEDFVLQALCKGPRGMYDVYMYRCPRCTGPDIELSELLVEPPLGFCPGCGAAIASKHFKKRFMFSGYQCPTCRRRIAEDRLLLETPEPQAVTYCISCGKKLGRAGAGFCEHCGASQRPPTSPAPQD